MHTHAHIYICIVKKYKKNEIKIASSAELRICLLLFPAKEVRPHPHKKEGRLGYDIKLHLIVRFQFLSILTLPLLHSGWAYKAPIYGSNGYALLFDDEWFIKY